MTGSFDTPPFLQPDEHFRSMGAFRLLRIFPIAQGFAKEFQIDREIALASMLAGAAHSMGGLGRVSTTFGSFEAPFSLLLVTPETEPVWSEVPVRFLTHEFEATMMFCLETYLKQKQMEGRKKGEDASDTQLKGAAELAERLYVDRMVERITTNSILFPPFADRQPCVDHYSGDRAASCVSTTVSTPGIAARELTEYEFSSRCSGRHSVQWNTIFLLATSRSRTWCFPEGEPLVFQHTLPNSRVGKAGDTSSQHPQVLRLRDVPFVQGSRFEKKRGDGEKPDRQHRRQGIHSDPGFHRGRTGLAGWLAVPSVSVGQTGRRVGAEIYVAVHNSRGEGEAGDCRYHLGT